MFREDIKALWHRTQWSIRWLVLAIMIFYIAKASYLFFIVWSKP